MATLLVAGRVREKQWHGSSLLLACWSMSARTCLPSLRRFSAAAMLATGLVVPRSNARLRFSASWFRCRTALIAAAALVQSSTTSRCARSCGLNERRASGRRSATASGGAPNTRSLAAIASVAMLRNSVGPAPRIAQLQRDLLLLQKER
jgi:hypothetical protein